MEFTHKLQILHDRTTTWFDTFPFDDDSIMTKEDAERLADKENESKAENGYELRAVHESTI